MAIDYSRVPIWLDNVFEDRQRSPQLSFRVQSETALGSLEEVFEEEAAPDTNTEANGYHRQQLVVTSSSGEGGDRVRYSTGSRSASSSCGSPRGQAVCSPRSHCPVDHRLVCCCDLKL